MKNIKRYFLIFSFIIFTLLASCKLNKDADNSNNELSIILKNPVVLSHNNIQLIDGSWVYINLEIVNGYYEFDRSGGNRFGNNWIGEFQLRVYENSVDTSEVISITPLNSILTFDDELIFSDPFDIKFNDYNNDGNPDFVIGQWLTSFAFQYTVLSINGDGKIIVLQTETNDVIFQNGQEFSINLNKTSNITFETEVYDNVSGLNKVSAYEWAGDKFILLSP